MQYNQTHFSEPDDSKFEFVIPVESYVTHTFAQAHSPFRKRNLWRIFQLWLRVTALRLVESLLGTKLYAEDILGPLKCVPAETLDLLSWLSARGYIRSWRCNALAPGQVNFAWFSIVPNTINTPDGKQFMQQGELGNGIGYTLAEATTSALGEFIERHSISSSWWERSDMVRSSIFDLQRSGKRFLDPRSLRIWRDNEESPYGQKSVVHEYTEFRFVRGHEMFTEVATLIPASTAYMFFAAAHEDEPILRETNSNGAAAHTILAEAEYRAACELIERDAFLRAWYHQRDVPEIECASVPRVLPEFEHMIKVVCRHPMMRLAVFDITSDIGVPTFCAMLRSHVPGRPALTIGMAADIHAQTALQRTLLEVASTMYNIAPHTSDTQREVLFRAAANGTISGYRNRRALWAEQEMAASVNWLSGSKETMTCDELFERYAHLLAEVPRTGLKRILREQNVRMFIVRFANDLTKHAGINVVRAISPELIPLFFNEQNRPLNIERFAYTSDDNVATICKTPHPFM